MRKRIFSLALAMPLLLALLPSVAVAGADFSGKTLTVLVGYPPGGPVDNFARLIANNLSARLPGTPTVVVQNKPGAGGVLAANYLFNVAKKDGSAILVTIAPFTNQFIEGRNVKFVAEKFYWLGAENYSNTIYLRKDLGVSSPADLLTVKNQIVIGGLRPNSSRDLYMMAFLEAIGRKDYKYVKGYQGTREIRTALMRGEVNFSTESVVALVTDMASDVQNGDIVPIAQSGLTENKKTIPDARLAKVPTAEDLVIALKGDAARNSVAYRAMKLDISMFALGRAIFAPPGVDPDAGHALRAAISKLNTDADFQQVAAKMNGGMKLVLTDGAESQEFAENLASLVKSDPAAVKYLEEMAKK